MRLGPCTTDRIIGSGRGNGTEYGADSGPATNLTNEVWRRADKGPEAASYAVPMA